MESNLFDIVENLKSSNLFQQHSLEKEVTVSSEVDFENLNGIANIYDPDLDYCYFEHIK